MTKHFAAQYDEGSERHPSTGTIGLYGKITDGLKAAEGRSMKMVFTRRQVASLLTRLADYEPELVKSAAYGVSLGQAKFGLKPENGYDMHQVQRCNMVQEQLDKMLAHEDYKYPEEIR